MVACDCPQVTRRIEKNKEFPKILKIKLADTKWIESNLNSKFLVQSNQSDIIQRWWNTSSER